MPRYVKRKFKKRTGSFRRRYRSKQFGRRTNRYGRRKLFNKRKLGFMSPDALWVKLKYSKRHYISASDPSYAYLDSYCGTNIYDPEYATGGVQPTGFDQYMSLYKAWYCPGSKVKMTIFNANSHAADFTLWPSTSVQTTTPSYDPTEQKFAKRIYIAGNAVSNPKTVRHYMTYARLTGTSGQSSDVSFWGTDSTGPTLDFYWNARGKAVSNLPTALWVDVEVTYYCKFFNRKNVNES